MAQDAQWKIQEYMLQAVADALGPELLPQVAFVGGCTTALLITDDFTREGVRFTEDVDVMVHVLSRAGWYRMQDALRDRGFRTDPDDDVVCRMRLPRAGQKGLIVDFMPDEPGILGFSNRWYPDALRLATDHRLPSDTSIRVVTPPYFLATKLEAWKGRGKNDPMSSRDVEDILNVVDGRVGLVGEVAASEPGLRQYIAAELTALMENPDFEYVVQSTARGSRDRESLIFGRLEALANLS